MVKKFVAFRSSSLNCGRLGRSVGDGEPCELGAEFKGVGPDDIQLIAYDTDDQILTPLTSGHFGGLSEGHKTISVGKRPASVAVFVIAERQEVEYTFRFQNIPLPDHASMPEQTAKLAFPDHDAPVTVEFVSILPDPSFPKAR